MRYIYVMSRPNGDMKIGFSCNPERRRTAVKDADVVLASWRHEEAHKVERVAHRLLEPYRQDGEWFSIDRYTAFDAVSQAMQDYDLLRTTREAIQDEPEQTLAQRLGIDMSGDYPVPMPPPLDADRHRLAYLRPLKKAPGAQQMKWLLAAAVPEPHVYMEKRIIGDELDAAMKDCREGDLFFAWSPRVFGSRAPEIAALIQQKGADLVLAVQ